MSDINREQFEKWIITQCLPLAPKCAEKYINGVYQSMWTESNWQAWQAARSQPERVALSDQGITESAQSIMRLAHTYACATGSVARACANKQDPTDERKHQSKCYAEMEASVLSILSAQADIGRAISKAGVGNDGARDAAVRFAGMVLAAHRNDGYPGDIDGADLERMALECGMTEERTVTERCGETCSCFEFGGFPSTCLFNTDAGRAAIAASAKEKT